MGKKKTLEKREKITIFNRGGETKQDPNKTFNGGGQKEEGKKTKTSITNLEANIT